MQNNEVFENNKNNRNSKNLDVPKQAQDNVSSQSVNVCFLGFNKMSQVQYLATKAIVRVKRLANYDPAWSLPSYATDGSAGLDVRACLPDKKTLVLEPNKTIAVPTGLAVEIPPGFEIQVRPKSGLSLKSTMIMPNSPGTIDSDYRGEVHIVVRNIGDDIIEIDHGLRLAQWVLAPVVRAVLVEDGDLSATQRGSGGFGSTGLF